jgi:hypothetical protein
MSSTVTGGISSLVAALDFVAEVLVACAVEAADALAVVLAPSPHAASASANEPTARAVGMKRTSRADGRTIIAADSNRFPLRGIFLGIVLA